MKGKATGISVALYDESNRFKIGDRLGIRVRVIRNYGGLNRPRDYYPSAGPLAMIMRLSSDYSMFAFEMKGKTRISIRKRDNGF